MRSFIITTGQKHLKHSIYLLNRKKKQFEKNVRLINYKLDLRYYVALLCGSVSINSVQLWTECVRL